MRYRILAIIYRILKKITIAVLLKIKEIESRQGRSTRDYYY